MGKTNTKFIFVSGGVISGVGKGIMAASLGAILKSKGFKVSMQKCDPYFNVDAGLLDPHEHGETFVTRDGAETDLDLGHYERFLDEEMTGDSTLTSGKLYKRLIDAERAGKFGGKTVQLVPHVTSLIQQTFLENAQNFQSDIHIVEIGGTVGDLEGSHFIEAIRAFPAAVGRENCYYVHVCYVPWLSTSGEFKTKPAQNSLRDLREFGIIPDMVVARLDAARIVKAPEIAKKLATFCGIKEDAVVLMPNAKSVYEVPLNAVHGGALTALHTFVNGTTTPISNKLFIQQNMPEWQQLAAKIAAKPAQTIRVGLVAKYTDNTDTYLSITEALKSAAWAENIDLELVWINAQTSTEADLANVNGILIPDSITFSENNAAAFCLKHNKPFLGISIGLQTAPTKRLGNCRITLKPNTKTALAYGTTKITERHRPCAEPDQYFIKQIKQGNLIISGTSPDGKLIEFVESPTSKFFIAAASHPEFRSRPTRPHPLFVNFIKNLR